MATIKWRLKGTWLKNCSCNPGCPCDFWAPPTHHKCEGMLGMHVDEGFYGKTSMKGVTFLAQYHWPGPLHEGNGTVLPILDERSSPPQREAVLQILSGKAGNAWFEVVASLVSRVLEPKVAKIEFFTSTLHGVQDRRGLCGDREPRVRADPVRLARESQLARGRRADAHGTQALDNSSGAKPRRKSPARIARMIASRSRGASTSIHARPKWTGRCASSVATFTSGISPDA